MISIYLERREPARNRQRFYAITVTRTLFNEWAMMREWGRIGQAGTVRETWFETEGEAIEASVRSSQGQVDAERPVAECLGTAYSAPIRVVEISSLDKEEWGVAPEWFKTAIPQINRGAICSLANADTYILNDYFRQKSIS